MGKLVRSFAALLAFACVAAFGNSAGAVTYSINASNGCCGTGPFGTVEVTESSGVLHFDVTLFSQWGFFKGTEVFGFNLAGNPTIKYSGFDPATFTGANTTAGTINFGALGQFGAFEYAVNAPGGGGVNANQGSSLKFNIELSTGGGLTLASLEENALGFRFVLDLCQANGTACFATGVAGGGPQLPPGNNNPVPLPGAVVLMGTILAGAAGVAGWRRRRREQAA